MISDANVGMYILLCSQLAHGNMIVIVCCCAARLSLLLHPPYHLPVPGTTPAVLQAQDSDGYSPLMEAAAQGHLAVAKQLLRARADTAMLNKVFKEQGTPTAVHT